MSYTHYYALRGPAVLMSLEEAAETFLKHEPEWAAERAAEILGGTGDDLPSPGTDEFDEFWRDALYDVDGLAVYDDGNLAAWDPGRVLGAGGALAEVPDALERPVVAFWPHKGQPVVGASWSSLDELLDDVVAESPVLASVDRDFLLSRLALVDAVGYDD